VSAAAPLAASPDTTWPRPGVSTVLAYGAVIATILAVHAPAIAAMRRLWDFSPMYSYGYLVPFVSAFLVWSRWPALMAARLQPSIGLGLAALAAWALLFAVGRLATVALAEELALVVAVAAAVLWAWGLAGMRIVWPAVAYLLLMVPLWDGFTEPLHPRFQNLSASIGVRILDAFGIPAHRDGTFITLSNLTLEVARACSGVNYLVAVLALGLPLGYLYLRSPWRRVVLIVSGLIIAALSNSLRVAMIGILVHLEVGVPLHGPGHVLQGLFVSGIGFVALFVSLALLRRGDRPVDATAPAATVVRPAPTATQRSVVMPMLALSTAFWMIAAAVMWRQPAPVALTATLERLPVTLGQWTADPYSSPAAPPWWPGADDELRRTYRHGDRAVDVYVAYFRAQRPTREVVTYQASDLHRVARTVETPFGPGAFVHMNVADEHLQGEPALTLFWYDVDGAVETAPSAVKLRTFWHAVARGRSNGAVVCLRTRAPEGLARPERLAELTAFAGDLRHSLATILPGGEPLVSARVEPVAVEPAGAPR
jgi:EpsI family protein